MSAKYTRIFDTEPKQAEVLPTAIPMYLYHRNNDTHTWSHLFWTVYVLCLHVFVIFLLGKVLLLPDSPPSSCLLGSELPFAESNLEYVETRFLPGGFTDKPTAPNPYLGPPNADRDALWEDLYAVGMVTITAEEAQQLRVKTTHVVEADATEDDSSFLVTIEVFHQLHCLDYVRHASYDPNHHPDESEWSKKRHIDHCLDYLRQVLMCHGDLTPITLEHIPGVPALPPPNALPYRPDFAIEHTCRNFELIYDFALRRNTSGYTVA